MLEKIIGSTSKYKLILIIVGFILYMFFMANTIEYFLIKGIDKEIVMKFENLEKKCYNSNAKLVKVKCDYEIDQLTSDFNIKESLKQTKNSGNFAFFLLCVVLVIKELISYEIRTRKKKNV